ncbi:MAG: HlyD family efflux transporter periplasmic adaptor subunit [Pseudomonadota bacterium]
MKKGGLFRFIRVLVVLVIAVAVAVVLVAVRPRAQKRPPERSGQLVETLTPVITTVTMPVEAYGTVSPGEQVNLVAQVRGTITRLDPAFTDGGAFTAGTVLLTIDPRDYELEAARLAVQIQQARTEIEAIDQRAANLEALTALTRANAALAHTEYQRLNELADLKVSSVTQRDQAHQRYLSSRERLQGLENEAVLIPVTRRQAAAALEMAHVLHRQALLNLERTRTVAPFDGRVLEKRVETGEHVSAGAPLGIIYRQGELEVDIRVPIEDLPWLRDASGNIALLAAEISVSGHTAAGRWPARIARTQAAVDAKTRTLPIVVAVDAEPPAGNAETRSADALQLLPGMFVTVRILGRTVSDMIVLPRHVVYPGDVVYLADGDRLKIQPVTVMRRYLDEVFVTAGLTTGDRVISTPLMGAVAGMPIRGAAGAETQPLLPPAGPSDQ